MTTAMDSYCRSIIERDRNMLVPWWIMAAWAYDERIGGETLVSDALFDEIAARLEREWEMIEHWHKPLLDRRHLKSALAIGGKYPLRSMHAADWLIRNGPPPVRRLLAEERAVLAPAESDASGQLGLF